MLSIPQLFLLSFSLIVHGHLPTEVKINLSKTFQYNYSICSGKYDNCRLPEYVIIRLKSYQKYSDTFRHVRLAMTDFQVATLMMIMREQLRRQTIALGCCAEVR